MPSHRSIESQVEEQARRSWLFPWREEPERNRRPVVTVSRQYGARGAEVARSVAEELGFDFYDREIIHRIAEDAHESERVVAELDEKDRELLTDWMTPFATDHDLGLVGYRHPLRARRAAAGRRGGRGAEGVPRQAFSCGRGRSHPLRPGVEHGHARRGRRRPRRAGSSPDAAREEAGILRGALTPCRPAERRILGLPAASQGLAAAPAASRPRLSQETGDARCSSSCAESRSTSACRLRPWASMVTTAGKSRTRRRHMASGIPKARKSTPSTASMQRA